MEIIICILIVIIFILFLYLIFLKKEIKNITKKIQIIDKENSNILLNKEFDDRTLHNLINQINVLIKAINQKEIDAYTKNKSMKKMITNIAHDLRTPLTSAIGYIDLLKKEELPKEEKQKYIIIIEERLSKLSNLITNFFDFCKIILKDEEIELKEENIIEILENEIVNFYDDFSKQNRIININCKQEKIELVTNKMLLIRIFDNLLINSYKHSKSDVTINVENVDNKIRIEVINKLEDYSLNTDEMFDEFYTSDISRTKGNTGLGLAIAKEFVQLLNGKIYAKKNDGFLMIVIEL